MSEQRRQVLKFDFYKIDPQWRLLPPNQMEASKEEFVSVVEEFSSKVSTRCYSLVGIRGDCDFLLWRTAWDIEAMQDMGAQLNHTALAPYYTLPYSYLAMKRPSQYVQEHRHEAQEGSSTTFEPSGAPYFIVYPFLKTREWYLLSKEDRQGMMNAHFEVGHKYPTVRINTAYSFGLDDQEFLISFEATELSDFLELVMELRGTQGSRYTLRDTPIFTSVAKDLRATLDQIG
jgi:chlorite dismutase